MVDTLAPDRNGKPHHADRGDAYEPPPDRLGAPQGYEELAAAELAIIEDPAPPPISPADLTRLLASEPDLSAKLDRDLPCWGRGCNDAKPCGNCISRRKYFRWTLHRLDHGQPIHPADVAGYYPPEGEAACAPDPEPERDAAAPEQVRIVSAAALVDAYPSMREPIIDGLLRTGETMNLISAPKVGKSWTIQDMALAVANGRPWLDVFPTKKGNVLIVDNELHRETIAARLKRMAEARDAPIDSIDVLALRGYLQDLYRLRARLASIEHGRYRLIVIDAFYRALPQQTDENDNGTMAQLYNCIDAIADRLGAAFALVHHAAKGSQAEKSITDVGSGAGAQSRAVDAHLILRPHEEDGVFVLDAAVRSFPPVAPRCLRWDFPVWRPAPDLDPTALRSSRPRKQKSDTEQPQQVPWTAKRFADAFGKAEATPRDAILDDARLLLKSDNKAKELLKAAIAKGYLYAWKEHGANSRSMVSTVPRSPDSVCVRETPPHPPKSA